MIGAGGVEVRAGWGEGEGGISEVQHEWAGSGRQSTSESLSAATPRGLAALPALSASELSWRSRQRGEAAGS
jgi:hypothetical protein